MRMNNFTNKEKRFFNMAENMAQLSTYKRYKVGCVIVYHNKVISTGCNKDISHPLQKKYDLYRNIPDKYSHKIHAEVDAIKRIINLDIDWNKVSIYVYRKMRCKPYGISRPCNSCMKLIKDIGIHKVYYTGDIEYHYECMK